MLPGFVRSYGMHPPSAVHKAPAADSSNGNTGEVGPSGRLFSFGVISDIQYANIPDGFSFKGTRRYYRAALPSLQRAVKDWKRQNVDFAMHFGDILDGYNPKGDADAALQDLIDTFDTLQRPHWHMIGNHCLYNLPREVLNARLRMEGPGGASYYSFSPHAAWRIVVLDGYDISLLGWPPEHPLHQQAQKILDENNPNQEKNSPDGLEGPARRYVKFGGAASAQQLSWLRQQLSDAREAGQQAIVCCHLPLHPGTCPGACLLWNYQEALDICREASNVVATISGHAHQDGYVVDDWGLHHRVLNAVVETEPGTDCYGIIDVYSNRLELRGIGDMVSAVMHARHSGSSGCIQ